MSLWTKSIWNLNKIPSVCLSDKTRAYNNNAICVFYILLYRKCGVDYPFDTVILHTWPRMKFSPQVDPFSLKVETYLRANEIPYVVSATFN